ncbi:hypothetical protein D3C80_2171710 [compost metagenome]
MKETLEVTAQALHYVTEEKDLLQSQLAEARLIIARQQQELNEADFLLRFAGKRAGCGE